MTAHELARKLLELPDVMVTVRGYEGGVDEVKSVCKPAPISLNANPKDEWWYGRHEYSYEYEKSIPETMAIHLTATEGAE